MKVGYFIYPPHICFDKDENKPYGPLISFFNEYHAKNMNAQITWVKMTNKRAELALKDCKINMFILKGYSKDREQRMMYPEHPFHHAIPSLLVSKDYPANEIRGSEDLYDQVIGWTSGLPKNALKPYWNHPRITLKLTPQTDFYTANMKMFMRDRLTGVASSNRESLLYMAGKMKVADKVNVINLPQESRQFYQTFSKCSEEQLVRYNQATNELLANEFANKAMHEFYLEYMLKELQLSK